MASLVLGVVGTAAGAAIGGGISILGTTLSAAQIGGMIGAAAGSLVDNALFAKTVKHEGPRLNDLQVTGSTEGAPVLRAYGRLRAAGQMIWAARFKETVTVTKESAGGGKGFGGGGTKVENTDYSYSLSFAIGLAEGQITRLGRVWADGKIIDLSKFTTRFYPGTEDQLPDALIEQIEGTGSVPGFRGVSYIVFEDLPLAEFGNRIPQLQFEIFRALTAGDASALDNAVQGVCLVPGSGEFVLATEPVMAEDGAGGSSAQNRNNNLGVTDIEASLDQLQQLLPNCRSVVLVVCWFGDDLRCGVCTVKPKVEVADKTTTPFAWSVNGLARDDVDVITTIDGRPAFGGTPADASVLQAIAALKARGFAVHLYPFVLMDIPPGNAKPDPYGGAEQAAYPWRGRITCHPAAGQPGTPDKTATAGTQANAFFTNIWGYRRMVLHYAGLCGTAGGVDGFLLGSELEGLTKIRSSASAYPVVTQLQTLAADVKAILPAAKLSYAANWSEYANHRPDDGTGDVLFHLDPLWADSHIDAVAIDNYMPLADWRDGAAHLDFADGRRNADRAYLDANVEGGECFDWFYANDVVREAQTRTPIADPVHGEPFIFRFKDLRGWWEHPHYNRPGGVRSAAPTGWIPESKPLWFTEVGCPAVDKGANQPNVFVDPKSAESALPYFSRGTRDDLIQRRALETTLAHWAPGAGHNPMSSVYGGRMLDDARIHVWCWDSRAYPDFPARRETWTDAPNWRLGHWLNGRVGLVPLADLVADLCAYAGFTAIDVSGLTGLVTGFVVERPMSVREALEPLMLAYQFDAAESEGVIRFFHKDPPLAGGVDEDGLVLDEKKSEAGFRFMRAQETDLPVASRVGFIDASGDYRAAAVESRRLTGHSDRIALSQLPLVLEPSFAQAVSDSLLMDAWERREGAAFALPPSALALDPGDAVALFAGGRTQRLRITEIADAGARKITSERTDPSIYALIGGPERLAPAPALANFGKPLGVFLDLPLLTGTEIPHAPHFAAYASPWPGAVLLYRSPGGAGFALDAAAVAPASLGTLNAPLYAGPVGRWDRGNEIYVDLISGTLASRSELDVLGGANALAVQNADGDWEIVQFAGADLIAPKRYRLSQLLRGQAGTEGAMRSPVAAGARVVVLGTSVQAGLTQDERALTMTYRYGPAGADFSSPAFVEEVRAFQGVGLRPLSPAHVRRKRVAGDDVISWKRRTRIGGDDWAQIEVPLAEESETYEVEILSGGGAVLRTLSASTPSVTYTAAMQTADWGAAAPNDLVVRVYQISQTFGRGTGRSETVYLGVWW